MRADGIGDAMISLDGSSPKSGPIRTWNAERHAVPRPGLGESSGDKEERQKRSSSCLGSLVALRFKGGRRRPLISQRDIVVKHVPRAIFLWPVLVGSFLHLVRGSLL